MKGQSVWFGFGFALLVFVLGFLIVLSLPLQDTERLVGIIAMFFVSGLILVMSMPRD